MKTIASRSAPRFALAMLTVACIVPRPAMAATSIEPFSFDNADSVKRWSFHNGPEFPGAKGKVEWQGSEGHAAPGALAISYDFTDGGNYVQAGLPLPRDNDARTVRLWLKKPNDHRITIRVVDARGQSHQKGADYSFAGWQQLEVDLGHWQAHFGGPNDGRIAWPLRHFAVLIENSSQTKTGTLLIDDIEFLSRSAGEKSQLDSGYTVTRFTGDVAWHVGGGEGNRLENGEWHYTIHSGSYPSLNGDISLYGRPKTLRLVLDSDGSGHGVHLRLASHWQTFHRQVAKLDKPGPMTIEIPLAELSSWDHYGGPNDGQVRYPLRLVQIHLDPTDGSREGTLRLHRLEADIRFAENEAVLLVPDIRHDADQVTFSINLRSLRPEPVSGKLLYEVHRLDRRLSRQVVDLTLPGRAELTTREFPAPLGDAHFLEASFRWIDGHAAVPPVSIGMSTVPEAPGSSELQPESLLGMGLYLYRWQGNPQAPERMEQIATLARKAGVKWSREEIQWHRTEPRKGEYNWAFYDQLFNTAHRHGISVYGLLCYWSNWTRPYTQEGIDDYCNWVRQVVGRYKDRIHHWEIWNEPNIFFWSGPKELYTTLLNQAYAAVKEVDPDAVVMGCSTSAIDTAFIRSVMDAGGKFDALTIHPYRGVLNDLDYIRELQETRKLVGGREVWITEIGFPAHLLGGYSERRQASLVSRVYLSSVASGAIRNVSWYDFRNDGDNRFDGEQNFGVVRSDLRPKPGYRALATVCTQLAGMTVKEPIDIGADAYAFRFSGGADDLIAACAPARGRVLSFTSRQPLRIVNGMGEPVEPAREGYRHTLTLSPGFPVFISGERGFDFEPVEPVLWARLDKTTARAGDTVELSVPSGARILSWQMPLGWAEPERAGCCSYELNIPPDAPAGTAELQAEVQLEGGVVRLPITLSVQPALIRM